MCFPPHPVQYDVGEFCQRCICMTGNGDNHRPCRPRNTHAVEKFERRSRMRDGDHHVMRCEERRRRYLLVCVTVCLNDHPESQKPCLYIPADRGGVAEPIDGDTTSMADLIDCMVKCRRIEEFQRILQSLGNVAKNLL